MSKKGGTVRKSDRTFLMHTLEMGQRGDISSIISSLSSYFDDKRSHPWHRIHTILEKAIDKDNLADAIQTLRDVVLAAFDMLSFSLALDTSSEELLDIYLKSKSWEDGRKKIRMHCSNLIHSKIKRLDVYHLDPKSLEHDGFSYLVSDVVEAQIETLRKGEPIETTKGKKKFLDLKKLQRSKYGRKLLREQGISEDELDSSDPRYEELLEGYNILLTELELENPDWTIPIGPTEQVTLNGTPVKDEESPVSSDSKTPPKGVQKPLTEYLDSKSAESKSKTRKKTKSSKSKKKKKGGDS